MSRPSPAIPSAGNLTVAGNPAEVSYFRTNLMDIIVNASHRGGDQPGMSEKHPDPARSPAPPDEFDMLTVHEVAAMLRVSTMTVYRLVDSRGYPHGAVGTPYAQPRQ
jgi:excisionase family DNA binding protein